MESWNLVLEQTNEEIHIIEDVSFVRAYGRMFAHAAEGNLEILPVSNTNRCVEFEARRNNQLVGSYLIEATEDDLDIYND